MAIALPISDDYLFARLHGLWANAVRGEKLSQLIHSTTPEILRQNLRAYHLDTENREEFHSLLAEREQHLLEQIAQLTTSSSIARWYRVLESQRWYENCRLLLHSRLSGDSLGKGMLLGGDLFLTREEQERLFQCPSLADYLAHFPLLAAHERELKLPPALCEERRRLVHFLLEQYGKEGDMMLLDARLDCHYYQRLLAAVKKTPLNCRCRALPLLQSQIDIMNFCAFLRNVRTYHLPLEKISQIWIDGGLLLDVDDWKKLAQEAWTEAGPSHLGEIQQTLRKFPLPFQKAMVYAGAQFPDHPGSKMHFPDLYRLESFLWRENLRTAERIFHNFSSPLIAMAIFPYLLRAETLNLGRVAECVYFAIPPEEIAGMMLGG